jgi:hypothetical protein
MTGDRLLGLYPRAWRERYGPEFLDLLGSQPLRLPQIIDVISGALDAHLSSDLRASVVRGPATGPRGGSAVLATLRKTCAHNDAWPFTRRDSWIGAGVIIGASIAFSGLGLLLNHQGMRALGESVKAVSFPAAFLASMPFTWMKGQPWKAQVAVVGGTLVIVLLIALS